MSGVVDFLKQPLVIALALIVALLVLGETLSPGFASAQQIMRLLIVAALLGIIAALMIAAKGSWRLNSIIIGVLVGGLLIWGAVAGVPWMAEQAESTIGMGLTPSLLG